jgi:hypothetical protein
MFTTKKAIAAQALRTKLGNKLIEAGHEFEDLADRVDQLISVGAATAIDPKEQPPRVDELAAQESPQNPLEQPAATSNVDAFLGTSIAAPVGQGSRRRSGGQRGAEG